DADLLEREPPERRVAPGRDRVRELGAEPGAAPREVVELELPAEHVRTDGERRVAEVRLREGQDDVPAERPVVPGQGETLAAPEQVVLLDARVEEQRVRRAEARAGAEGAGLRLLDVDDDVHAVVLRRPPGGDVHLLEEAEALE